MKMTVFWDTAPCGLMRPHSTVFQKGLLLWDYMAQYPRRTISVRLNGAVSQKAVICMLAVRTWNPTSVSMLKLCINVVKRTWLL